MTCWPLKAQSKLVWAVAICLSIFIISIYQNYGFQRKVIPLYSTHHHKILNSVRDWRQFGYFRLGGLLTFKDNKDYKGTFPDTLYRSHVPFYALPHWLGFTLKGDSGFYFVVVCLTLILAISVSIALASLSLKLLPETLTAEFHHLAIPLFTAWLSVPGEALWGAAFNNYDSTPAFQSYLIGLALVASQMQRASRPVATALMLIVPPLLAARFGMAELIVLGLVRLALWKPGLSIVPPGLRALLRPRAFAIVAAATSVHFIHIFLVSKFNGGLFAMSGSDWLYRMGFTPAVTNEGQGRYDYATIMQAISLIWRQSEFIQIHDKFPLVLDFEHTFFWGIGIAGGISLLFQAKDSTKTTLLMLTFLPAAILTFFLNQSASAHPDYYNLFWHPILVLGWIYLIFRLLKRVPKHPVNMRLFVAIIIGWTFFLWQIRYFLIAYPFQ